MRKSKAIASLICFCFAVSYLAGQTQPSPSPSATPEPYGEDEFPLWAEDLRRAEVITFGAFPLSFLLSNIVFDVGRWIYKEAIEDPQADLYTPLFFAPPNKPANLPEENTGLLIASISLSVFVAVLDFILGQDERAKQKEREERNAALLTTARESVDPYSDTGSEDPGAAETDERVPAMEEGADNGGTSEGSL